MVTDTNKKEFYVSPRYAAYASLFWIILCVSIVIFYDPRRPSWGDIGALLSGVFALLVWLWFYVSLQLQRESLDQQIEELSLQREELGLQREALQQSVIAQQGSKVALHGQFQALTEQLAITETQFDLFLEETEAKKPNFILHSFERFDVRYSNEIGNKSDSINLLYPDFSFPDFKTDCFKPKSIHIAFKIRNIGGSCNLLVANDFTTSILEYENENHVINTGFRALKNSQTESIDHYLLNLEIYFNFNNFNIFSTLSNFEVFIINIVENIRFELVCRNYERSFVYNYVIINKGKDVELLSRFNSERVDKVICLPLNYLLTKGYEIKKKN